MNKVYLLEHTRNDEELDGFKVIGIFSSRDSAQKAVEFLKTKPGFRDYPDRFNIAGYEIDKIFWGDGFG